MTCCANAAYVLRLRNAVVRFLDKVMTYENGLEILDSAVQYLHETGAWDEANRDVFYQAWDEVNAALDSRYETVHCDRCHQDKPGSIDGPMTAGCYIVADAAGPTYWARYAERRDGENVICDACMWAAVTYQASYGTPANVTSRHLQPDTWTR